MHNGMSSDAIQGQGRCHKTAIIRKSSTFLIDLLHHLKMELANDH